MGISSTPVVFGFVVIVFCLHSIFAIHSTPPAAETNILTLQYDKKLIDGESFDGYKVEGNGPFWKSKYGISYLEIPTNNIINLETLPMISIIYKNMLNERSTVHLHGLTPPSQMDGIPFISNVPIYPNGSILVQFPLWPQNIGTYFGHSHWSFQHALGMAFPIIIQGSMPEKYPQAKLYESAHDIPIFLEDFCPYPTDMPNMNSHCNEQMNISKMMQDMWEIQKPTFDFTKCMDPVYQVDIKYRYHLINGKTLNDPLLIQWNKIMENNPLSKGIRFRFICATGMSNYKVSFPFQVTVLSVDGFSVQPLIVEDFWIAVGQRVDVFVSFSTLKEQKENILPIFVQSEGYATQGRSGFLLVRSLPTIIPKMDTFGSAGDVMGYQFESQLFAFNSLEEPDPLKTSIIQVNLTGDMGFDSINGKSYQLVPAVDEFIPNLNPILVNLGDRVCFNFTNFNSQPHSMHLHGHSYQVVALNGKPVAGAIRDTILLPRGNCHNALVCFNAWNPGLWGLHCHMVFHLVAGMFTTVEYIGTTTPLPHNTNILKGWELSCKPNWVNDDCDNSTQPLTCPPGSNSWVTFLLLFVIFFVFLISFISHMFISLKNRGYMPLPDMITTWME